MAARGRVHDDIYEEVESMDIADVYKDSQLDPNVNSFMKRVFYLMKEPQYLDWRLNSDTRVETDEMRCEIIKNKLESIKRSERLSRYLDEQGISLNSFNVWNRKFSRKGNKVPINNMTIPEWVRKQSKKCSEDVTEIQEKNEVERLVSNEALDEMKSRRAMTRSLPKKSDEKKPKKPEVDN
ncbi:hypothetical protein EDI_120650 [Entamoeba dispar SAW760]|uniref:Uncharacterized protein n=1 Tax=Entamoeba dispar (strain ATCC PRA-260 / SAW760) TaxID=370354 RepID=B0EJQ1_ENTDS|nr:uncharacterized protein EDI_120650 [Entamoeba dispar SAW760]EDR25247.1 hypothetical protein EDI_120650 [Entamoeba dispar SAW760]|eukprot:EDR25247.1 hypothetical protein EDI_120650 [Entamoeba dispar SAW760]